MENKYLIGLDEVSSELNKGYDKGLKNDNIAYFAKLLKVKTMRVWLNFSEIIKVNQNDEISLIYDGLVRLHDYLLKMKEAGVERFSLLTWGFVYPYKYEASDKFVIPDPIKEPDIYARFLKVMRNAIFEIASNFTEIRFFEPTNEPEAFAGINIHRNANLYDKNNLEYDIPTLEKIVLDLCNCASKAAKSANSKAKILFPGFCNFDSAPNYLNDIYTLIESNQCPSLGKKTNVIEDYFDIMNWHPYNLKDSDINEYWLGTINNIRKVMEKHNDLSRTIWFNEIGWSDLRRNTEYEAIAKRYEDLYKVLIDKLPFVETFFPFRLFTLANKVECEGEDNFGLVFNEYDWDCPLLPKPAFITLYKAINGENADIEPCYKLAKIRKPELYRVKVEGDNNAKYRVLFIGNAITYRKEAPWLKFNEARGLGSKNKQSDYVHLVLDKIKETHSDCQATLVDALIWEKTFYDDKTLNKLNEYVKGEFDLVVVFVGDNYGNASLHDQSVMPFYKSLLEKFKTKKTSVIALSSFKGDETANKDMKIAAESINVPYIDITYISEDMSNIDNGSYLNVTYKVIPNNLGHKLIAEEILKVYLEGK